MIKVELLRGFQESQNMKRGFVTTRRIPEEDFLSRFRPTAAADARGRGNETGSNRPARHGKREKHSGGTEDRNKSRQRPKLTHGGAVSSLVPSLKGFPPLFLILEPVGKKPFAGVQRAASQSVSQLALCSHPPAKIASLLLSSSML